MREISVHAFDYTKFIGCNLISQVFHVHSALMVPETTI